jgi:hypothetical protein
MHAEHGSLWQVDDRSAHHGAKDTTVANGEGTTSHVFNGKLSISGLKRCQRIVNPHVLQI